MGKLDDKAFTATVARCNKCDAKAFEVATFIDRQTSVMLGARTDDGRWTHDGPKFIDGIYRVQCIGCRAEPFASQDCPRCHRHDGLGDALGKPSRLAVPKRCPRCKCTELGVFGFAPATVRVGEGRPAAPKPVALLGDPSFHVAQIMCEGCDWVAVAEGCPLCRGQGPLRARPG